MMHFDNKIIVIGGNHHNMLGVVRSLGFKKYKTIAIITNDRPYSFVGKSKYIEKKYIVKENEEEILKILRSEAKRLKRKAFIIPTSDFAALLIDNNLRELSISFYLPSIDNKQGKVAYYMDKYNQFLLAKKNGIRMAKSAILRIKEKDAIDKGMFEKCILKPIISAEGSKDDIRICETEEDFLGSLNEMNKKGYKEILAQELIDYDVECGLIGCADNGKIIIPGIIKKIRIYPSRRGSNSYARIEKLPDNSQIKKIKNLLAEINYSGLFDIEIFQKKGKIYLNEINFRNSGNSFAYCFGGVNLPYLWILMKSDLGLDGEKITIDSEFKYIDERLEFKQLVKRRISLFEFLDARKQSRARLLSCTKDIKPSIFKIIYAIRRRVFEK